MNRTSEMDIQRIITLWRAGHKATWIAKHLGLHRETVAQHLRQAGYALARGRPQVRSKPTIIQPQVPAGDLGGTSPPESKPTISSVKCPPAKSSCEPHRDFIEMRLSQGASAQVIWQDLVDESGFAGSYDAVKRFVRGLRKLSPTVFAVMSSAAGEEAQVDYGKGSPAIHPITGKYRKPWLFVMTLSYSRKAFRKVVWQSGSDVWAKLHEEAFRHFGGVPRTIRLDNLKEGVIKADFYDPELNPLYAALLDYYGSVAIPCRVGTPRHKGKVEAGVKYAQNALKGRRFDSLDEQQAFLDRWDARWADVRIHGTIKRQVKEVFEKEERPSLIPIASENFPILQISKRTVHADGHVAVNGAYYSVPHACVAKEVVIHIGRAFVDIRHSLTGERLARHLVVAKGRYQSSQDHLPDHKRLDKTHALILRRAGHVGENTLSLVRAILNADPYHAIRRAQGVLAKLRSRSAREVEAAAQLCCQKGLLSYRAFKAIVERSEAPRIEGLPLIQTHELIRSVESYQGLWSEAASQSGEIKP